MHNEIMNRQKMTFKIRPARMEWTKKVAYPSCRKSHKLCQVLHMQYLLPEQLKMLELEGFELNYKKEEV